MVKARTIGLIGLLVAFLGLAGAVFAPLALEAQRPDPTLSDVLAETAVKIKDKLARKEPAAVAPPATNWGVVAIIVSSALGLIGVGLGVASWLRREDLRMSGAAVAVGLTAIGFHYIMAAIGVAIACVLIGAFLSLFD